MNDNLNRALARLLDNPDFETVRQAVRDERNNALQVLMQASEPSTLHRAQGRVTALDWILGLKPRETARPKTTHF